MTNELARLSEAERWRLLLDAAIGAVESLGFRLTRLRGRGRYSVFEIEKDGVKQKACIRTTRDRLISFPPVGGGKDWKTLGDIDHVIVSAVDSKVNPRNVEVYMFAASDVRQRFDRAYRARKKEGIFTKDKFGFWIALDKSDSGGAYRIGSGIAEDLPQCRVATFSIAKLLSREVGQATTDSIETDQAFPKTIADVITWARRRVAALAGVDIGAVTLDMKLDIECLRLPRRW